jgi:hypothetical protein
MSKPAGQLGWQCSHPSISSSAVVMTDTSTVIRTELRGQTPNSSSAEFGVCPQISETLLRERCQAAQEA